MSFVPGTKQYLHCDQCPLNDEVVVEPVGNLHAKVALIGEGPGQQEKRQGKPFCGPAGQHLDWLLKEALGPKVKRGDLWVSNSTCCLPGPRTFGECTESPIHLSYEQALKQATACCRDRLLAELAAVQPKVILAVGAHALRSLAEREGISHCHGAVLHTPRGIVVPMLHPAALLRNPKNTYGVIQVIRRAFRIAEQGARLTSNLVTISPTHPKGADGALALLESWVNEILRVGKDISIDVETTSEDARNALLTVVGFGSAHLDLGLAVTVKMWNRSTGRFDEAWTLAQEDFARQQIVRLLSSPLLKWYWNYRFDVTVLERYFRKNEFRGPHGDGLHLHWLIQPEQDHNLAYAVHSYIDSPPWKADFWNKQDAGKATHDDLLVYNAQDAANTARIISPLQADLRARGNDHLVVHQMRVAELARRAEAWGVPLDEAAWQALHDEFEIKQKECLAVMQTAVTPHMAALNANVQQQRVEAAQAKGSASPTPMVIDAFSPRSPLQARWYLFDFLRLPCTRRTPGGKEKDPDKQLESTSYKGVLAHLKNPLVKAYVDFSEWDHKLSMLDSVMGAAVPDGPGFRRILVSWNTTGMKGTRWTSKVVNLQNWQKKMRKLLRAKPGRKWVGADAAQIEYRIAATLAGIPELLALFNQPAFDESTEKWKKYDPRYDAHSFIATEIYGPAFTDAPMHVKEAMRTLVKRVVYGMLYGAMPEKILTALLEDRNLPSELRASLTLDRVQLVWDGFKKRFPQWDVWAMKEMDLTALRGYQEFPPFNRKRWWTAPRNGLEENKIRNTPIQLAAGDVCNLIFCNIQDRCDAEGLDAQMSIHGHDAIYMDCAWGCSARVAEITNEEFCYDFPGPAGNVRIHGQASIGDTVAEVG